MNCTKTSDLIKKITLMDIILIMRRLVVKVEVKDNNRFFNLSMFFCRFQVVEVDSFFYFRIVVKLSLIFNPLKTIQTLISKNTY